MPEAVLKDVGVLVVEDDYFIASDIERVLQDVGARVVGPFSRAEQARDALKVSKAAVAVLDINIAGSMIFPFASELRRAGLPFIFATGYDSRDIPDEFETVPRLVKPIEERQLVELIGRVMTT